MKRAVGKGLRSPRRRFLAAGVPGVAALIALAEAYRAGQGGEDPRVRSNDRRGRGSAVIEEGRLLARPATAGGPVARGLQPLGQGARRDGFLYVPAGYRADRPAPLVLMLHGAGGDAQGGLAPFRQRADAAGLILLAPDSRGRTWDRILGGYGPDVAFIDRALEATFGRVAVDPARIAIEGFSDGASYALSLGLINGDLFTHVIAFAPGFMAPTGLEGAPRVFIAHGTHDAVLPIARCSRTIVPRLERAGYDVHYREFDGPHTVPPEIAREALDWFAADARRG